MRLAVLSVCCGIGIRSTVPGGTYPITVGSDGSISLGRGANCPAVLTLTVEEIKALSDARGEKYLRVLGRCWGEKLFRRLVTKTYEKPEGRSHRKRPYR
jgi:hypothetical protein